jgi:hypothetical protein
VARRHPAFNHTGAQVVGYPLHRVEDSSTVTHPNGVSSTSWRAACGAQGGGTGSRSSPVVRPWEAALRARTGEMCRPCWA